MVTPLYLMVTRFQLPDIWVLETKKIEERETKTREMVQ